MCFLFWIIYNFEKYYVQYLQFGKSQEYDYGVYLVKQWGRMLYQANSGFKGQHSLYTSKLFEWM